MFFPATEEKVILEGSQTIEQAAFEELEANFGSPRPDIL